MWKLLSGRIQLEIVCADSISLLNAVNAANITLENVSYHNEMVLHIYVHKSCYKELKMICSKYGASVKELNRFGLYWWLLSASKRPVLMIFALVIGTLFCYLPSRILFVSVEGNVSLPENLIIESAEKCGIRFGASRRHVRSEKVKNALLYELPQLQWAGVNTAGCTAVIAVKEKTAQDVLQENSNQVSSIVASRDGVIQNCTVFQGNPLCSVGQAVKAGQTLVSGYLDCGIVTKTTQADAEIKALTFRQIEVLTPVPTVLRGEKQKLSNQYTLRIGKKLIKLYKDSGNSDISCGKIYSERYVQLPGGFQLPLAIIKETTTAYEKVSYTTADSDSGDWLADFTIEYLLGTMVAGEIISDETEIELAKDVCYLQGKYTCMEMIGRKKFEQMIIEGE